MKKAAILYLFLTIGFLSCKTSEKEISKLEIANQFYQALNNSDSAVMKVLLTDSLITKEMDYKYIQTFSKKEFIEDWLKWDSVFSPTYKVLEIEQDNKIVRATISKTDKRILLLHKKPTVWKAVLRFDADRIVSIERSNVVFNDTIWVQNRTNLINWINHNHPELNGFLNGQTESVALKYLKAIELYNNKD
ncbi:hypothetical protein ACOKFD_10020 [Flagellimonas sp. S174]|uniref:hypothetical protein n=1 Tax=Flagellimonas sp. S174 TaxID=3410790 RepID=UPI003BF55AC5